MLNACETRGRLAPAAPRSPLTPLPALLLMLCGVPVLLLLLLVQACSDAPASQRQEARGNPFTARDSWAPDPTARTLREALEPLHTRLGLPRPDEWRANVVEYGQTYGEYLASDPVRAVAPRRVLYLTTLGPLADDEREAYEEVAEFLGLFYGLEVKEAPPLALEVVPPGARRPGSLGTEQLLTTYILGEELPRLLPRDAAVLVALTDSDLWPGEGWYYVFGQGTWYDRVAVCSFHRLWKARRGQVPRGAFLVRALKLVTHETGHNFGMRHCGLYECLMDGSYHLGELDRHPLELCPLCLTKLMHATGVDPLERFRNLETFALEHGLEQEAILYRRSLIALEALEGRR